LGAATAGTLGLRTAPAAARASENALALTVTATRRAAAAGIRRALAALLRTLGTAAARHARAGHRNPDGGQAARQVDACRHSRTALAALTAALTLAAALTAARAAGLGAAGASTRAAARVGAALAAAALARNGR
jgi:hypothetical protein